jgi:hypothetical protein
MARGFRFICAGFAIAAANLFSIQSDFATEMKDSAATMAKVQACVTDPGDGSGCTGKPIKIPPTKLKTVENAFATISANAEKLGSFENAVEANDMEGAAKIMEKAGNPYAAKHHFVLKAETTGEGDNRKPVDRRVCKKGYHLELYQIEEINGETFEIYKRVCN